MKALYAAAATTFLAGASCGKSPKVAPPIPWYAEVAPACAAAARENKPVLFLIAASWDVVTKELDASVFSDPVVRDDVRRDWVALRVDRTNTYMEANPPPDEQREVDEAWNRFHPWASKYGSLVLTDSDCRTEIDRIDGVFEPRAFHDRLLAAQARTAQARAARRAR